MRRILNLCFLPTSIDTGLLVLRVLTSLTLYIRHGYEKMFYLAGLLTLFITGPGPLQPGLPAHALP